MVWYVCYIWHIHSTSIAYTRHQAGIWVYGVYVMLWYAMRCLVMPGYAMSCDASYEMLLCAVIYYAVWCGCVLYPAMLGHFMLCHPALRFGMLA